MHEFQSEVHIAILSYFQTGIYICLDELQQEGFHKKDVKTKILKFGDFILYMKMQMIAKTKLKRDIYF